MTQHVLTLDTLQYAKKLQKAGFTSVQAEAQIEIIKEQSDAINDLIADNLATKEDIKHLEERINDRILQMGYRTIMGLSSIIAVCTTILGFLIKLS